MSVVVPDASSERSSARDSRRGDPGWATWSDKRLLDLRLCDLGVAIRGSALTGRIQQLYDELRTHGLRFRPHFWLSDEWYCPDGLPGVAIPFYLAHPRLAQLELSQMLEIEGGTPEWCLRLLRHETGHAIENPSRLRRRRRRREVFGKSSERYRDGRTARASWCTTTCTSGQSPPHGRLVAVDNDGVWRGCPGPPWTATSRQFDVNAGCRDAGVEGT